MKKKQNSKPFAVVVTDVHLDRGNSGLVKDIFNQLVSLCHERGIYNVICAGDVFTTRSGQPLECLSAWREILGILRDNKIVIDVIPGNHDKTDGNDECSYLDVYEGVSRWVRLHRVGSTRFFCDNRVRVDFIPYFGTERWMKEFEIGAELDFADSYGFELKVLVTHMAFNGVRNADGSEVLDGIAPAVVKDYDVVICGHYHDRSTVGRNIHYVGSAYQNDYGEGCVDKGFAVLYEDGSIEYVQSHFPRYIKETIQATDRETLVNLLEKYGDADREDHVRFEFVGKKADLERLDVTEIQTRYGIECKFSSVEEREAVESATGEDVLNYDAASVTKNFYRFCAENNIRGAELKYGVGLIKILKCGLR